MYKIIPWHLGRLSRPEQPQDVGHQRYLDLLVHRAGQDLGQSVGQVVLKVQPQARVGVDLQQDRLETVGQQDVKT